MLKNPRLKFWPVIFLAASVEGWLALGWLGLIPSSTKSGLLPGISIDRLLMMAFVAFLAGIFALLGWYSWRRLGWREKWLDPDCRPGLFRWLTIVAFLAALLLEITWLFLRTYDAPLLGPFFLRAQPIVIYLLLICAEGAIWLLWLRFGPDIRLLWRQAIVWISCWAGISALMFWGLSPSGGGELHTWWYIQTFNPLHYELHGENYCSPDYSASLSSQYRRAKDIRLQLANIDRPKALLAIFNKITRGAKNNTEKQLKVLDFIQQASYHTNSIASYSNGDWVYDPLVLLELGNMYCTQGAILAIDLFGAAGYPGRLVQLGHHQISEIYYDGDWHYLDTDLFGDGETVIKNGKIPSVAELSQADYQKLDAIPAFQETNVMDCSGQENVGDEYPSYYYFSTQAYQTDTAQNYYVGTDALYDFEHGWKAVATIAPADKVSEYNLPEQVTPDKPNITSVTVDPGNLTLSVSFSDSDPDGDLAGYQVFISDHSRGWDYNQFYGNAADKRYWADPGGWKPEMYRLLFQLPPHDLGLLRLAANASNVNITAKPDVTYFVTIMAYDSYGLSVGRVLYPVSNEIKIQIP